MDCCESCKSPTYFALRISGCRGGCRTAHQTAAGWPATSFIHSPIWRSREGRGGTLYAQRPVIDGKLSSLKVGFVDAAQVKSIPSVGWYLTAGRKISRIGFGSVAHPSRCGKGQMDRRLVPPAKSLLTFPVYHSACANQKHTATLPEAVLLPPRIF